MAQWVHNLRIKKEWEAAKNDEITIKDLATSIAKKLKKFRLDEDYELQDIIDQFEFFPLDMGKDDFDYIMEELYDWADRPLDNTFGGKKNCWIEVF
jgi:hypothetical protein